MQGHVLLLSRGMPIDNVLNSCRQVLIQHLAGWMELAQCWIGKGGIWTQAVMSLSLLTAPVIFWAHLTTSFTLTIHWKWNHYWSYLMRRDYVKTLHYPPQNGHQITLHYWLSFAVRFTCVTSTHLRFIIPCVPVNEYIPEVVYLISCWNALWAPTRNDICFAYLSLTYMQHLVLVSRIDWKCVCMVSGLRVNPENRSGRDSFPSLQREGGRLRT
jgi:hypothetical protein